VKVLHTHKSGEKGTDTEAYRNTYKDGEKVHSEKAKDWGKVHNDSSEYKKDET
jgi:hypothetical protein